MTPSPSFAVAVRVVLPFAFGYLVSYLTRVVNAVIAPELTAELGLDAADLGLLTSVYFLAFAAFQLPLGLLLDRFGPRRTNSCLLLIAALGAYVFSKAESMIGLTLGRALIGLGVSGCLMAALTAYRSWFPKERLPLLSGLQMAAGGVGALTGTVPVEAVMSWSGWRGVFAIFAVAILAAAAMTVAVVPKSEAHGGAKSFREQLRGFAAVFRSPLFHRVAPISVGAQGTFIGIQSLWVGPWLADVARLERAQVAHELFLIAAAMVCGFLTWGGIADRLGRRGVPPMSVALIGMCVFQIAQAAAIALPGPAWARPIWLAFGFFGTANVLSYSMLAQSFPAEMAGRVNTALNLMVFVGAFAVQWGVGAIIDLWPPLSGGGYPTEGYQAAMAFTLSLQVAAMAWYAIYRRDGVRT